MPVHMQIVKFANSLLHLAIADCSIAVSALPLIARAFIMHETAGMTPWGL